MVLMYIHLELRHGKLFREWGVTMMTENYGSFSMEITRNEFLLRPLLCPLECNLAFNAPPHVPDKLMEVHDRDLSLQRNPVESVREFITKGNVNNPSSVSSTALLTRSPTSFQPT